MSHAWTELMRNDSVWCNVNRFRPVTRTKLYKNIKKPDGFDGEPSLDMTLPEMWFSEKCCLWSWPVKQRPSKRTHSRFDLSKFWFKSFQCFTIYRIQKISMVVAAWPWPFNPWPWNVISVISVTWTWYWVLWWDMKVRNRFTHRLTDAQMHITPGQPDWYMPSATNDRQRRKRHLCAKIQRRKQCIAIVWKTGVSMRPFNLELV